MSHPVVLYNTEVFIFSL